MCPLFTNMWQCHIFCPTECVGFLGWMKFFLDWCYRFIIQIQCDESWPSWTKPMQRAGCVGTLPCETLLFWSRHDITWYIRDFQIVSWKVPFGCEEGNFKTVLMAYFVGAGLPHMCWSFLPQNESMQCKVQKLLPKLLNYLRFWKFTKFLII